MNTNTNESSLPIEIRDTRKKQQFILDDLIIDQYAKEIGVYALCVYSVIARHVDKNQQSYPSVETIAEKLGISPRTVMRAIPKLVKCKMVHKEQVKNEKNQWTRNRYTLIDQSQWKLVNGQNVTSRVTVSTHGKPGDSHDKSQVTVSHTKGTHIKGTHLSEDKKFDQNSYLEEMKKNTRDLRMKVIAVYAEAKNLEFEDRKRIQAFIRRNVRAADEIPDREPYILAEMMDWMNRKYSNWSLETMSKKWEEIPDPSWQF